jgi:probable rRNA maturation factor
MGIEVQVAPKLSRRILRGRLRRVALRTLLAEGEPSSRTVTVVITDDKELHALNLRFLHVDAATDVLSFTSDDADYLGDVVISYETACQNASAAGWNPHDELCLLVVHGILHLLGYEDSTPRGRARMWSRQEKILGRVAVNDGRSYRRPDRNRSRSK